MTLGLFVLLATTLSVTALEIGETAPPLEAAAWMNGDAVDPAKPDGKTTYVVEFWATWCGPCRQTIPHLNGLHAKLKDRGVVIVGVSDETEAKVKPFVEKMGMKYLVAIDSEKKTGDTYMKDVRGIPIAFIIDKNGKVIWKGHPLNGLDAALDKVVAGTFDADREAKRLNTEKKLEEALSAGDLEAAMESLDTLIDLEPSNFDYHAMKIRILTQKEDNAAIRAMYPKMLAAFADSAESLNNLAWMTANTPYEIRDLDVAWQAANKACELTQRKAANALDSLARVYYALGMLDEAISIQSEAVAAGDGEKEKASAQAMLDYYRSALALREKIARKK